MRLAGLIVVLSAAALAKPKSSFIEIKTPPTTPRAIAAAWEKEKPGPARTALLQQLEAKLREKAPVLDDADAIDGMVDVLLGKVFEEMAAANDVWVWEPNESPRGDVLIRKNVKLLPGRTSTGFDKSYTVKPKGKRIDRGFLNENCTVQVNVAKSPNDWNAWVEAKGWGAAVHPVHAQDNVARVVVQLLSPGKPEAPGPRHERPVWLAFFKRINDTAPWELLQFESYTAKEQKLTETNFLVPDPKASGLTEAQRQLVLDLRMEDVRLINPDRQTLSKQENVWLTLAGLTENPVTAKNVAWLEPYRSSDSELVRAVATVRSATLGGKVEAADLVKVMTGVRTLTLQAEALGVLNKMFDASTEKPTAEDLSALKAPDAKVLGGFARIKKPDGSVQLFSKGATGWEPVSPKK